MKHSAILISKRRNLVAVDIGTTRYFQLHAVVLTSRTLSNTLTIGYGVTHVSRSGLLSRSIPVRPIAVVISDVSECSPSSCCIHPDGL